MRKAEVDQIAGEVMDGVDEEIATALAHVVVYVVDGRADPDLRAAIANAGLAEVSVPSDFRGIFLGTQAPDYGVDDGPTFAEGSIVLNAQNLFTAEEVRDTLAHEMGHALGLSEEDVENLGLG